MFALRQGLARLMVSPSTPLSRHAHASVPGRTGLLAIKGGMIAEFDEWGRRFALTVLIVDNCQVIYAKTKEKHGYYGLQLGVCPAKPKNVSKPMLGHYGAAGVAPKRKLAEFRVKGEDALLPPGTVLGAGHFVPGQLIDVCGITKGKGYQGGMKRHGFGGMRATHGTGPVHRSLGSTGQCQDPGRVFKGKKMAGRMGSDRVTVQNLWVYKIDTRRNLVYVKGQVPGQNGGFVRLTDAVKGPQFPPGTEAPFPTYFPQEDGDDAPNIRMAPSPTEDPLAPVELD